MAHTGPSTPKSLFAKLSSLGRKLSSQAKPDDVHHLRTTARRLETLITAHDDALGGRSDKLAKQLARLRRKAGKVRDFDVQMDALRAISLDSDSRDKARLISELESERAESEKKLLSVVAQEFGATMRKRVRKAQDQLSSADPGESPDYVSLALDKFAVIAEEYAVLDENNLHAFRIAVKRVRYLAELGDTDTAKTVVAECKRVQDTIGDWHDLVMLLGRAERLFVGRRSPLVSVLRTTRDTKFTVALRTSTEVARKLLQLRNEARRPPRKQPSGETQMIAIAS
jgi:CHAD domain-containing protein